MSDSKRHMTSLTYMGVVYLYSTTEPQYLIQVSEADLEQEHWLVELLVRLFPVQENFAWYGAHVILTPDKTFNLKNFSPTEPLKFANMLEFTSEDIFVAFRKHPTYKKLETMAPA